MAKNKLAALATSRNGDVRRVYRRKGGGYTLVKDNSTGGRFRSIRKPLIRQWARKHDLEVVFTRKDNPFVIYDTDTGRVNKNLEDKLNEFGRRKRRYVWVGEGKRTDYQQWKYRMAYLRGDGNLAARCCLKYWPDRVHSWANCGKQSQSNHRPGNAADGGLFMNGLGSWTTNFGQVEGLRQIMRELECCLPVPGEDWHAEEGNYWAA